MTEPLSYFAVFVSYSFNIICEPIGEDCEVSLSQAIFFYIAHSQHQISPSPLCIPCNLGVNSFICSRYVLPSLLLLACVPLPPVFTLTPSGRENDPTSNESVTFKRARAESKQKE